MRPSGEGERENSRQDFLICEYGERWPFSSAGKLPFANGSDLASAFFVVRPLSRRRLEVLM